MIRSLLSIIVFLWSSNALSLVPSNLLMNARTGEILVNNHAHVQRFPASLTKMMTLYVVFEKMRQGIIGPNDVMTVSKKASQASPTKLYLQPGDSITVIDGVLAITVKSANDAAITLAEYVSGDEEIFALEMNRKAKELGMKQTIFRNASGLPNREQVSTANDMAILAKALLDHFPEYRHIFSTQTFSFRGKQYKNTNGLLGSMEGVDGMKTGYTHAAGWNLATSYHRDSEHLIGVVMGEKSRSRRDMHMRALLEGRPLSLQEIRRITTRTPDYFKQRTPFSSQWGIQVGVFRNGKQARHYVQSIKKDHFKILKDYTHHVTTKLSKRVKLFHARFKCGSQNKAQEVCDALKKRGVECFVLNGV